MSDPAKKPKMNDTDGSITDPHRPSQDRSCPGVNRRQLKISCDLNPFNEEDLLLLPKKQQPDDNKLQEDDSDEPPLVENKDFPNGIEHVMPTWLAKYIISRNLNAVTRVRAKTGNKAFALDSAGLIVYHKDLDTPKRAKPVLSLVDLNISSPDVHEDLLDAYSNLWLGLKMLKKTSGADPVPIDLLKNVAYADLVRWGERVLPWAMAYFVASKFEWSKYDFLDEEMLKGKQRKGKIHIRQVLGALSWTLSGSNAPQRKTGEW